jgi:hypothetical protein
MSGTAPLGTRILARDTTDWDALTDDQVIAAREKTNRLRASRALRVVTGFPDRRAHIEEHTLDLPGRRLTLRVHRPRNAGPRLPLILSFHGGGFIAGITLAVGVILQYIGGGTRWAEDRLAIRPTRWIAVGLLLAAGTGAGAWLFGHPFLTSHMAHFELPMLGELHVPSALFFDLGVFALVVGATGLVLIALAHQSTRAHRPQRER